jgi:probable HAF family extracellular repeat protein
MVDLGTLGGSESEAAAVNDSGEVVGFAQTTAALPEGRYGIHHAFFWTRARGMVDLGTLGGRESRAFAVNASGHVVGSADNSEGHTHATLWNTARARRR